MLSFIRGEPDIPTIPSDLHNAVVNIFKKNNKCNVILLSDTRYTLAMAKSGKTLYPMLDDIAQLTGASIKSVSSFSTIKNRLNRKSALFIKNKGCLCCGADLYEAQALSMVIEKGSMAHIATTFLGGGKTIRVYEALMMRLVYLLKYSKKSKRKV